MAFPIETSSTPSNPSPRPPPGRLFPIEPPRRVSTRHPPHPSVPPRSSLAWPIISREPPPTTPRRRERVDLVVVHVLAVGSASSCVVSSSSSSSSSASIADPSCVGFVPSTRDDRRVGAVASRGFLRLDVVVEVVADVDAVITSRASSVTPNLAMYSRLRRTWARRCNSYSVSVSPLARWSSSRVDVSRARARAHVCLDFWIFGIEPRPEQESDARLRTD